MESIGLQRQRPLIDTLPPGFITDTVSINEEIDSLDSIQPPPFQGTYTDYRISKDSLDAEVDYSSYDSMNVYFDK
ncbi:MAG: hypothetical protein AAF741_13150, partial [Bacteroidota bacterium]